MKVVLLAMEHMRLWEMVAWLLMVHTGYLWTKPKMADPPSCEAEYWGIWKVNGPISLDEFVQQHAEPPDLNPREL